MKKKLRKLLDEEHPSRKKLIKAAVKRQQRKTLYPFGFEYASWRK